MTPAYRRCWWPILCIYNTHMHMIVYMYIWFKNTDIVYKCPWCGSPTISSPATWFFPVEILQKTDVPVGEKNIFFVHRRFASNFTASHKWAQWILVTYRIYLCFFHGFPWVSHGRGCSWSRSFGMIGCWLEAFCSWLAFGKTRALARLMGYDLVQGGAPPVMWTLVYKP